jgi:hypothetical protein
MVRKTISVGPDSWKALSSLGRFGMSFDDIIKILLLEHNELMRIKGKKEILLGPSIYKQSQEAQEQGELETGVEAESQPQSQHEDTVIHSARYEKAKSNGPITTTAQQSQPPQQLLPQEQKPEILENTKEVSLEEIQDTGYPIFISKIEYPISRNKLIQDIKGLQYEFLKKYNKVPLLMDQALLIMERLPDRSYKNRDDLNIDLAIVINDRKVAEKLIGKLTKTTKIHGCAIYNIFARRDEKTGDIITIDRKTAMDRMIHLDRRLRSILGGYQQKREFRQMLEQYQQNRRQSDTMVTHKNYQSTQP